MAAHCNVCFRLSGTSFDGIASDGTSHIFEIRAGKRGLAFPKCFHDWGRLIDSSGYDDLWLAEFEKLQPLSAFPKLESEVRLWIKVVIEIAEISDSLVIERDELERVRLAIPKCETPTSLSLVAKKKEIGRTPEGVPSVCY